MSKSVFISHAVRDKALAKEIVDLIEDGMGVPEDEIFCSSLDGYGIPSGQNFVTYIKSQLFQPKVVVLILTPAYFESKFCVSELGAAWIMSHEIFPILVPPLQYDDVKDVLLGIQVAKVDNDIKYNELLSALSAKLKFAPKSQTKWDTKRRSFLKAIEPLLKNVAGPSMVPAATIQAKDEQLAEARSELDASEEEIRELKERLTATEALKDKAAVAALKPSKNDKHLSEQFNAMTDAIKEYKSVLRSRVVLKFVLSDYYSKPYNIDWHSYKEEFEEAVRLEFLELEEGEKVIWSNKKMKALSKMLAALGEFVSENKNRLESSEGEDVPLSPSAQDFWEYHYEV